LLFVVGVTFVVTEDCAKLTPAGVVCHVRPALTLPGAEDNEYHSSERVDGSFDVEHVLPLGARPALRRQQAHNVWRSGYTQAADGRRKPHYLTSMERSQIQPVDGNSGK